MAASPGVGAFNPQMFQPNGMFLGLPNGGKRPIPAKANASTGAGGVATPAGGTPPPSTSTAPGFTPGTPLPGSPAAGGIVNPSPSGTPGAQSPPNTPLTGPFVPQMFSSGLPAGANTSGFQSEDMSSANYDFANQGNLINQSSGILDFASGNPTSSPLYKSLLSGSRDAISNSYDQAVANTRAAAASRGFGYESPSEQGEEAGLRGSEAGAFSAAPSQALEQTIAPELTAAGIQTTQAGQYAGEGTSLEQMITALQQARMGKQSAMAGDISGIIDAMISGSAGVAKGFTPNG